MAYQLRPSSPYACIALMALLQYGPCSSYAMQPGPEPVMVVMCFLPYSLFEVYLPWLSRHDMPDRGFEIGCLACIGGDSSHKGMQASKIHLMYC